ncbi:MAG: FeoB-associated Cys-rich membrane protein [Oscillospiraceae bacterium]
MLDWIAGNLSSLLVAVMVAALVTAVASKLVRDKKQGKSSCGCQCANCPNGGSCHKK